MSWLCISTIGVAILTHHAVAREIRNRVEDDLLVYRWWLRVARFGTEHQPCNIYCTGPPMSCATRLSLRSVGGAFRIPGHLFFFDVGPLHDRLPFTYTPRSSPIRFHATKTKAVGDRALFTSTSHPPDEDVNAEASYAQSAATWSAGRHRFRCEMRLCGWK